MSVQVNRAVNGMVAVQAAVSHRADSADAIAELRERLGDTADLYAIFVSTGYNLDRVATAISTWCEGRVIACTSSGNIGPEGYDAAGITAIALSGGGLRARTISLSPLTDVTSAVEHAAPRLAELRAAWEGAEGFAILLVDGLSMREDRLVAELMAALGDVPIIGGSAGDALTFTYTAVYSEGRFESDIATLTMVTLDAPFELFRLQHHEPTDQRARGHRGVGRPTHCPGVQRPEGRRGLCRSCGYGHRATRPRRLFRTSPGAAGGRWKLDPQHRGGQR